MAWYRFYDERGYLLGEFDDDKKTGAAVTGGFSDFSRRRFGKPTYLRTSWGPFNVVYCDKPQIYLLMKDHEETNFPLYGWRLVRKDGRPLSYGLKYGTTLGSRNVGEVWRVYSNRGNPIAMVSCSRVKDVGICMAIEEACSSFPVVAILSDHIAVISFGESSFRPLYNHGLRECPTPWGGAILRTKTGRPIFGVLERARLNLE